MNRPTLVLFIGVTAISFAALLVRLAVGVEPVAAAFWRTAAAASVLGLASLLRGAWAPLSGRDRGLAALAGLFLGAHFWIWFASVHLTTVFRATLLVCLTPIWAALLEWGLLGERPSRRYWMGIGLALLGVGAMSGGAAEGGSLRGDLLATLGGVLSAAYLLIGRTVRPRVAIDQYGALVYGSCALAMGLAALATGAPLSGYPAGAWLALLGMTLGPQLMGHLGLNYAVRYLPASVVTAAILCEPVGAALTGALFLAEQPGPVDLLGGALCLLGVGLAMTQSAPPVQQAGPSAR